MTNHPNRSKQQKAKHTPGPWHVTQGPTIQIGTRYFVETTNSKYPISNADACLIAAAPELLAALKDALLDLEALAVPKSWPSLEARIAGARAAIAKACNG